MARTGLDIVNEINAQNSAASHAKPAARIVVTTTGEFTAPWFLIADTGYIRPQFVDEIVRRLFGRQRDGSPHEWSRE